MKSASSGTQPATRDLRAVVDALDISADEFRFQAQHIREKIDGGDYANEKELTFLRRLKAEYMQAARSADMLRDYRARKLARDDDPNTSVDKRGRATAVHDDD